MRTLRTGLRAVSVIAVAITTVWLAGCRTTGYHKSDVTAIGSEAVAAEVQAESRELENTMQALNDLVNHPADDAKPQFLQFSAALDRLDASTRQATRSINRMWSKRAAYFDVWEKEIPTIKNEEMRQVSQARKAEVSNEFDASSRRFDMAQNQLRPLITYLQDIRKALSTDLTRDGLTALQPSVTKANETARTVQASLAESAANLDALSSRTASFRVREL